MSGPILVPSVGPSNPLFSLPESFYKGLDQVLSSPEFSYISPGISSLYRHGPSILEGLGFTGSEDGTIPYFDEAVSNLIPGAVRDTLTGLTGKEGSDPSKPGTSGSLGYYPSPSAQQLDYLGADLARHYGMDRTTAYNEAMANSAYQRAVADMQMAGLNPASLFSGGRASSAGSGYASGVAGGYSSARGASQDDGNLPGWIYYGVSGLAQAIGTAATKSPSGGYVWSQVAQTMMKAFNDFNK